MRLSEIERQVKDQVGSEEEAIRQYKELRSHISELQAAMRAVYMQPQYCLAFLKAGRIVSVYDKQVWEAGVGKGRKQVSGVHAAAVLLCLPEGGTHRVGVRQAGVARGCGKGGIRGVGGSESHEVGYMSW